MQAQEQGFMRYGSLRAEIAAFVESIKAGRQPGATITHGPDVLRVLDGIYGSAETGRKINLRQSTSEDSGAERGEVLTAS